MYAERGSIHTLRVGETLLVRRLSRDQMTRKQLCFFLPFIVLPVAEYLKGEPLLIADTGSITDTTSRTNHIVPCVPWKIYEQVISIYYLPDFRDPKKQRLYCFIPLSNSSQSIWRDMFVNMGQRRQLKGMARQTAPWYTAWRCPGAVSNVL